MDERTCRGRNSGPQKRNTTHADGKQHSHSHSRNLDEILKTIAATPISEQAKQTASAIFVSLGEAEAKVHNVSVEAVHFHEVGAADAIVDIVCAAVGAEALQVDRILASPLNVGSGTVKCAHGVMPVPAPATLELLKGIPVYSGEVQKELVTPTGAAIVKVVVAEFGATAHDEHRKHRLRSRRARFSAAFQRVEDHCRTDGRSQPNTVGHDDSAEEDIVVLEANLDDLSPQIIGYIADQVLARWRVGRVHDAVQMKKGRPGTLLTVLAKTQDESKTTEPVVSREQHAGYPEPPRATADTRAATRERTNPMGHDTH